jgi:hypothetical protein
MNIEGFLNSLPNELQPIREVASGLSIDTDDEKDDTLCLSHRPRVAPQAHAIKLFKPLPEDKLVQYQDRHGITVPARYLSVLRAINGAHIFKFSLFGVPPSMVSDPPLLNRSGQTPYDVATANMHWIHEYAVPKNCFHFGGGPYSDEENCGYFFASDGAIFSTNTSTSD